MVPILINAMSFVSSMPQCQASIVNGVLDAIRQVESSGNNNAVSPVGARGPYQFMPNTWAEFANGRSFDDAFDPTISRKVAYRYIVWIKVTIEKWSKQKATLEQVCSAYNGGIGRLRRCGFNYEWMPKESVSYVHKIKAELN